MLEWKILAAIASLIIVISILFAGNSGIGDTFGGIAGRLTDWLGGTPVNLPNLPGSQQSQISLTFYPKNFTLDSGTKLNLTLGESQFENFNGMLSVDFESNKIMLREKSGFSATSRIQPLTIQEIKIPKLMLTERFVLHSSLSNITADNSTITVQGFSGSFSIQPDGITLSGNVTRITGDGWTVG